MNWNQIVTRTGLMSVLTATLLSGLGAAVHAQSPGRVDQWQAADPPAAVEQLLRLGKLPAGYGTAMPGAIDEDRVKKIVKGKGTKTSKTFKEVLKDGSENTGAAATRPVFKAKVKKQKDTDFKAALAKPKVELRKDKATRNGLVAKPFDTKRGKKTKLKALNGTQIDTFETSKPLVSKPTKSKSLTMKAKIDDAPLGRKWQLKWPKSDFKALKKATEKAKDRSKRNSRRRIGLQSTVNGMIVVDNKTDEAPSLLTDGDANADGDRQLEGKIKKPAKFVVSKLFDSGAVVSFKISERKRKPRIRLFNVRRPSHKYRRHHSRK